MPHDSIEFLGEDDDNVIEGIDGQKNIDPKTVGCIAGAAILATMMLAYPVYCVITHESNLSKEMNGHVRDIEAVAREIMVDPEYAARMKGALKSLPIGTQKRMADAVRVLNIFMEKDAYTEADMKKDFFREPRRITSQRNVRPIENKGYERVE